MSLCDPSSSMSPAHLEIRQAKKLIENQLRPLDTLNVAVKLQSKIPGHVAYLAVVEVPSSSSSSMTSLMCVSPSSPNGQQQPLPTSTILLGMDYQDGQMTLGVVYPLTRDSQVSLVGDGAIRLGSGGSYGRPERSLLIRPVSVQTMWYVFQSLLRSVEAERATLPPLVSLVAAAAEDYLARVSSTEEMRKLWKETPIDSEDVEELSGLGRSSQRVLCADMLYGETGMLDLPPELQWKILGMIESRADWRLVSRDWSSMATRFWMESGEARFPISYLVLNIYISEQGGFSSASILLLLPPSVAGCLHSLLRPLAKGGNFSSTNRFFTIALRELSVICGVLSTMRSCIIDHANVTWRTIIVENEEKTTNEIPFEIFGLERNGNKWDCGKVLELLRGTEKAMRVFASDAKPMVTLLTESVDVVKITCLDLRFPGRFCGVQVEEWPSLAEQIVKRGVDQLILDSEEASPFNEDIALEFQKRMKPLLLTRFCVTLPLDVNDSVSSDEYRFCSINRAIKGNLKELVIEKIQDDFLDFFNPRFFDIAE